MVRSYGTLFIIIHLSRIKIRAYKMNLPSGNQKQKDHGLKSSNHPNLYRAFHPYY